MEPGKRANLRMFVRQDADPVHYFAYQPQDMATGAPRIPPTHAQHSAPQSFEVTIHFLYGRKQMKFDVSALFDANGNLQFQWPNGGGML
jgi:hypothetical protein